MSRWRSLPLVLVGLLLGPLLALTTTAAPAGAWPWDDAPANGSDPDRPATWGRTSAANQTLLPGCRTYRYRYLVTPPSDEWSIELFLMSPKRRALASGYYLTPEDPDHGAGTWRLCTTSATPGVYTIKMRVTWDDGRVNHSGWVRPSRFRLSR
jgi:hypothetical protein